MATIITKNSATAGNTPSNLTQGELAINVADGRLFYGSGSSSVVKQFDTIPTASHAENAGNASAIDIYSFSSPVDSYLLMSNVVATTGVAIGGDSDLRYNSSTNVLTVPNISATTLTGSLLGTAATASYLNTLNQNLTFNGNLTLNGTASISYLNVQYETASVIYSSGSNQFGDAANDTQTLYGTVVVPTGSLSLSGSAYILTRTGSAPGLDVFVSGSLVTSQIASFKTTATTGYISLYNYTSPIELVRIESSNDIANGGSLRFYTKNTSAVMGEKMRVTGTGEVGIGTTAPAYKLDVNGSGRFTGNLTVTGSLIVSGANGGINTNGSFPVLSQNNGVATVTFGNGKLWLNDSVGGTSVDWGNRYLLDTSGTTRVDWGNGDLNDSAGIIALNWESRRLYTPAGNSFRWDNDYYTTSNIYHKSIISTGTQNNFIDFVTYAGQIINGTVDAAANSGSLVDLESDGIWYPVKNLAPNATRMLGICLDQAGGQVLIEGDVGVSDDDTFGTYVVSASMGSPVYVGTANGVLDTTQPTSGVVRVVGHIYYQSTTDTNYWLMKFRPSNDWYEQ